MASLKSVFVSPWLGTCQMLSTANASYYVIYYEKFRKIMQWTENEALKLKLKNFVSDACWHVVMLSEIYTGVYYV